MQMPGTITLTGKGSLKVHPDMTRVSIRLTGVCEEYDQTLEKASQNTKTLGKLLKKFGFKRSDLKTVDFSVDTETESYKEDDTYKYRVIGYRFDHSMKIEFDSDNKRLGKILYALAHSSLDPEFSISYTIKDPESVKNKLLAKAVKDAKEKAEVLTSAAGASLGKILSIDYSWSEIRFEERSYELAQDDMLGSAPDESYDLDIEPDDIKVSDTVTIVWKIK